MTLSKASAGGDSLGDKITEAVTPSRRYLHPLATWKNQKVKYFGMEIAQIGSGKPQWAT
jgi:hypothetical protein